MAIVQNVLIGASRKKIGNAVFSTWKGINVLKSKPVSVADPKSDAQLMQRSAVAQTVAIFREIPDAIRLGYKEQAVRMSEYNAFARQALKQAFNFTSPPTATFEPTDFSVSKGTIASTTIATCVADKSLATIVVTFITTPLSPGQSNTDPINMVAYNSTQYFWTRQVNSGERADGTESMAIPADWNTGDTIFVYLFFTNTAGSKSSDSTFSQETIIA